MFISNLLAHEISDLQSIAVNEASDRKVIVKVATHDEMRVYLGATTSHNNLTDWRLNYPLF